MVIYSLVGKHILFFLELQQNQNILEDILVVNNHGKRPQRIINDVTDDCKETCLRKVVSHLNPANMEIL